MSTTTDLTRERLDELERDATNKSYSRLIYTIGTEDVLTLIAMARAKQDATDDARWRAGRAATWKLRTKQAERERDALRDKIDSFIATLAQVGATMTLACPECQGRMRRALEDNELWEHSQRGLHRRLTALAQSTTEGGA